MKVTNVDPVGGVLVLLVSENEIVLGNQAADEIFVTVPKQEE